MLRFPILAAATLAAAPALAQSVTVETARGSADVAQNPETVLVYDVAAIDTLDALGVAPDGVIGGRSSEQLDPLSQLAPTIDMTLPGDDLVAVALDRLDAYGTIFGKQAEADALAAEFDARLAEARDAVAGKGTALIVMTNGPKVSAYGAGSRFGWLHQAVGLPEAVEGVDTATHGEAISFEFIRDADPDWLLVIDRAAAIGAEGERARQTLDNALVADTTAWSGGQVIHLDAAETYIAGGGIQSMTHALDRIIEGFGADPDA